MLDKYDILFCLIMLGNAVLKVASKVRDYFFLSFIFDTWMYYVIASFFYV